MNENDAFEKYKKLFDDPSIAAGYEAIFKEGYKAGVQDTLSYQDSIKKNCKEKQQMIIKTCDLKVKELDFVVAQLEAIDVDDDCYTFDYGGNPDAHYSPSQHWHQAGPIIERENIAITGISFPWFATELGWWGHIKDVHNVGTTPLIAAMRCYVQSKWGKEVNMKTVYEALQVEIGE